MAAIIECEAGGESYEGKVGVGAVIMNRIRSGEFPNTLSEVIYQSGQFEPTWTGKLSNVLSRGASEACYEMCIRDSHTGTVKQRRTTVEFTHLHVHTAVSYTHLG